MKKYENLFSPIQVGSLTLRNRIALAPMSFTVQNFDRGYPQEAIQMIERIAKGGCGLIIMGETVCGEGGKSHDDMIMLDEPSMGLAPMLVQQIFDIILELHNHGTTILLVEQNAQMALSIATRGYVLETGSIVLQGSGQELLNSDAVKKAYLGG